MIRPILALVVLSMFSLSSLAASTSKGEVETPNQWMTDVADWFRYLAKEIPKLVIEQKISVPVYGNYCGPNHGDPTFRQEPIDSVDAVCKRHDRCYDPTQNGHYQSCACDAQMVNELARVAWNDAHTLSREALAVGAAMGTWFAQSPCYCRKGRANPFMQSIGLLDRQKCEFEPGSPFLPSQERARREARSQM
jgi:hypothetical protein